MGAPVNHKRMKRRITSPPNAVEQRHMARIAEMPCLGCGLIGVELHHSLTAEGKRCRRDHRFIIPVCPACHRGPHGIHGIGCERQWGETIGIDPGTWAVGAWRISEQMEVA